MAKRKSINVPRGTLFAALITASLVLLLMPVDVSGRFNFLFVKAFGSILNTGNHIRPAIFQGEDKPSQTVPRDKYESLKIAYDNLNADFLRLHKDNERLALLRMARPSPGTGFILAEVVASTSKRNHEIYINRGSSSDGGKHGVRVGQYVLAEGEQRIVGTVKQVDETVSLVRLVTDLKHSIPVVIWREGIEEDIEGQLYGDGKSGCKIPLLSHNRYDIKVGDSVFAKEAKGFLNTRRLIGVVTSAAPDDKKPLLWDITVTPMQSGKAIEKVAVIVVDTEIKTEKD